MDYTLGEVMNITLPDTILRNDEIINIKKQDKVKQPLIISDTIPIFIQDKDGMWIKNPEYIECNN